MPLQVDILCDRMVGPAQPPGRRKGVTCFVRVRALAGGRLSPCASPDVADKERHWGFLSPTPTITSVVSPVGPLTRQCGPSTQVHTRRELMRAYRPATFQRGHHLGSTPRADEVMGGSEEGNALRYCVR